MLRWAGAHIGNNVRIVSSARFYLSGELSIGDNTWIGEDALVVGGNADVKIGCNVDIGPRVVIVTGSHRLWETSMRAAGSGYSEPIVVSDGVWIGACATVLGGVTIGECAMVASSSLVNRSIEPFTAVAGIPSKLVKRYR